MRFEDGLFEDGLAETDQKICRYLSFAKFMSLLGGQTLFLSRLDMFADPLEGRWTRADLEYLGKPSSGVGADADHALELFNEIRGMAYASCWAKFTHESDAHWRLYAAEAECIAVVTTIAKLRRVFDAWMMGESATFALGAVRYVDHLSQQIANEAADDGYRKSLLRLFALKNVSFRWEEEVRAVVLPRGGNWPKGIEVPFDPTILIDEVIIGPQSAPWFQKAVEAAVRHYGLNDRVRQSDLFTTREVLKCS